ncbi:unnamed protein product, partial [Prorocentrum cordatum]
WCPWRGCTGSRPSSCARSSAPTVAAGCTRTCRPGTCCWRSTPAPAGTSAPPLRGCCAGGRAPRGGAARGCEWACWKRWRPRRAGPC